MTKTKERQLEKDFRKYVTEERIKRAGEDKYWSDSAWIFSFLMGMYLEDCEDMYPDGSLDSETLEMYDFLSNVLWDIDSGV